MRRSAHVLALALLAAGCSSTGRVLPTGRADAGGVDASTCFESTAPNQGCIDCVEGACASPFAGFAGTCSDFVACECPGGYFDPAAATACATEAAEPSCAEATMLLTKCETQSCGGQCVTSAGTSGSGG